MSWALSADLRKRIVKAYERGEGTYEQLALRFDVGRASVARLVQQFRRTGSVAPCPRGGGNPAKVGPDDVESLCELISTLEDPSATDIAEAWSKKTGRPTSRAAMQRALHRFSISYKKSLSEPSSSTSKGSNRSAQSSRSSKR